jgi:hypothetical protein
MSLPPEPRVRRDGLCIVCRKPRVTPTPLQRGVPSFVYERDPFCSSVCARTFYGNPLASTDPRKESE